MNKIIFPLRLQMRGDAVADLQDGLLLLLDKGRFQMSASDRRIWGPWKTRSEVLVSPEGVSGVEPRQMLEALERLRVKA